MKNPHVSVPCDNPDLLLLLQSILRLNPKARPDAQECLQTRFFLTPVQFLIDYRPPLPDSIDQEPQLQFKNDLELDQILGLVELEALDV